MSEPVVPTSCIYCGEIRDLTSDHVPPKNLFRSPRPTNLVTVPACRACNKSFEKDDEYFRVAVLAPADKDREPIAAQLWKEKIIHGTLKRSPALKSVIRQSITSLDVHTPGGIYLGTTPTLRFSRKRLDRVVRRIVTALHWHHYGHTPRPGVNFTVSMGPDPKHPGVIQQVALNLFNGKPYVNIGGGAFRYAHARVPDNPDWGAWLLAFYTTTLCIVILSREEE